MKIGRKQDSLIYWLSIAVPVFLCIVVFFQDRSLFLDSLNLARNIGERSFAQLPSPLSYEQSAPLLFLYLSKIVTSVLGISSYTLRLIPLLASIGTLILWHRVGSKLLDRFWVHLAIFWIGTHELSIRYATEYKQYMTDALATTILIWMALHYKSPSKENWWKILLISISMLWFSMPAIFTLAGVFAFFLIHKYKSKESSTLTIGLLLVVICSFMGEYFLILAPAAKSAHMQNFHADFFLQGKFWNTNSLSHDGGLIVSYFRMLVGKSGLAIASAIVLFILGTYSHWKIEKARLALLVFPILGAFGASMIGKYSILERLMLFSLPLLVLMIISGAQYLFQRFIEHKTYLNGILAIVLSLGLLVGFYEKQGFKYLFSPYEKEDNLTPLLFIADSDAHRSEIICTPLAYPTYDYYVNHDRRYKGLDIGHASATTYKSNLIEIAKKKVSEEGSAWVLATHMNDAELNALKAKLNEVFTIKNSHRANHSTAILFLAKGVR